MLAILASVSMAAAAAQLPSPSDTVVHAAYCLVVEQAIYDTSIPFGSTGSPDFEKLKTDVVGREDAYRRYVETHSQGVDPAPIIDAMYRAESELLAGRDISMRCGHELPDNAADIAAQARCLTNLSQQPVAQHVRECEDDSWLFQ